MSETKEFHPGALIRCPGCGTEVHASENDGEAESRFRCRQCRAQHAANLRLLHPELFTNLKEVPQNEQSNRDIPPDAASSGKRSRGNQAPQQPANA